MLATGSSVLLRRFEFPVAGRFHREAREVSAGAVRCEFRIGDGAGGIDRDANSNRYFAVDRVARALRNIGHNAMEDVAFCRPGRRAAVAQVAVHRARRAAPAGSSLSAVARSRSCGCEARAATMMATSRRKPTISGITGKRAGKISRRSPGGVYGSGSSVRLLR